MRQVVQALVGAGLVMGFAGGAGCVVMANGWSSYDDLFERQADVQVTHMAEKPLHITTDNGAIRVSKGGTDQVAIEAKIKAVSQERAEAVKIISERAKDGTLTVRADWPSRRKSNEGCSFNVRIPDVSGLELQTDNGAIECNGLSGLALVRTSNGAVSIGDHQGNIDAKTSNGEMMIDGASGWVKAVSSNGEIVVSEAGGKVEAESSNGSLVIALAQSCTGPVEAQTSNGSVKLLVGKAFKGRLEAESSRGGITMLAKDAKPLKVSKHEGEWIFAGDDAQTSTIETSNGSVTIETSDGKDKVISTGNPL